MKNFILTATIAVIITSLFTACDKEDVVVSKQDVTLTLQGIVYDAEGSTPLEGVLVHCSGDTTTTGSDGFYTFEKSVTGSYILEFAKDGYAAMAMTVGSASDVSSNATVVSTQVDMYKADQSMSITFIKDEGAIEAPIVDMPVTITFSDSYFLNSKIEVMTDSQGKISIDSLPNSPISIFALKTEGNYEYRYNNLDEYDDEYDDEYETEIDQCYECKREISNNNSGEYPRDFTESTVIYIYGTYLNDLRLHSSNIFDEDGDSKEIATDENIIFSFSDDLEAIHSVKLSIYDNGSKTVLVESSISGNTLTVNPLGDNLVEGSEYYLSFEVSSINGDYYYNTYYFYTEGDEIVLSQVQNLGLDDYHSSPIIEDTDYIQIEFNQVENATDYEVFARYSGSINEYREITTYTNSDGDDAIERYFYIYDEFDEPVNGFFADAAQLDIIVRAIYNYEYGPYSNVLTIELGDSKP